VSISVVVVNWNAGAALGACLASLDDDAGGGAEVIVVDNASTDGSTAAATGGRPWARVLVLDANVGFARGANAGADVARGDPIVFLNPDARVAPGALARLADELVGTPAAGIAGGGLVGEDGRWQPGAARFGVLRHLVLDTTLGRLGARRRRRAHRVDWVYGTFMAVRRDVLRALGGFDGGYFIYGEDLDLCYRARLRGWTTIHVPAACAVHGHNVSATGRFGLGRDAAVVAGELRFFARRGGPAAAALYRVVAGGKFAAKAVLAAATGRHTTARRAARVVRTCLGWPGEAPAA
jgi:N-acetylglucosaminyl-diphospho-decaprenol L-rhamnosyltransferase